MPDDRAALTASARRVLMYRTKDGPPPELLPYEVARAEAIAAWEPHIVPLLRQDFRQLRELYSRLAGYTHSPIFWKRPYRNAAANVCDHLFCAMEDLSRAASKVEQGRLG